MLKRLRFIGQISPVYRSDDAPKVYALLVPRGIALDELNLDREQPFTDADLTRALNELRIQDYPQRARAHAGGDMTRRADPPASSLLQSDDSTKVWGS
jgi:hypothetical protein